jgi:hypothetical protein
MEFSSINLALFNKLPVEAVSSRLMITFGFGFLLGYQYWFMISFISPGKMISLTPQSLTSTAVSRSVFRF